MKIAFVLSSFPALSETFILNQITGLMDLGHDVDVYFFSKSPDEKFHPDVSKYDLISRSTLIDNVPSKKVKRVVKALQQAWIYFPSHSKLLFKAMDVFRLGRVVFSLRPFYLALPFLDRHYDILQCHYGPNGTYGAMLKQIGIGDKLVTMFHGWDILAGLRNGPSIYRRLFRNSDCILSISAYNYKNLVAMSADDQKIRHHSIGIDTTLFSPTREGQNRKTPCPIRLLTVARLAPEKGLEVGLHALKNLLFQEPTLDIIYRIVGDGSLKEGLQHLTRKLGLETKVEFAGGRTSDEVIEEMNHAHLFLLPSHVEALPVVLMEAMAMKLPVVATSVGSTDELVHECQSGFLVEKGDAVAMAKRLSFLIKNPQMWEGMGHYGRQIIKKKHEISTLNRKLVDIYRELLSSNS